MLKRLALKMLPMWISGFDSATQERGGLDRSTLSLTFGLLVPKVCETRGWPNMRRQPELLPDLSSVIHLLYPLISVPSFAVSEGTCC